MERSEFRQHFDAQKAKLDEANAKIEQRAGRNLLLAVGSGVLFGSVFLVSLFAFPRFFVLLVSLLVLVSVVELATALRGAGRMIPRVASAIAASAIVGGTFQWGIPGLAAGLLAGVALVLIWRLVEGMVLATHRRESTRLISDLSATVFTLIYVAVFGAMALLLRAGEYGDWWVFTLIAVVVSTDVGAYAAGVLFGAHKMTPRISPNKTWEGFAGGALASQLVAIVLATTMLHQPWWVGACIGFGLLLSATGGDLTESLIKRDLGIKDMSRWIPGHGGFLDRLDSILPSVAVMYCLQLLVT